MTKKSAKKSPRISVNKLAEYLEATPQRRKAIVFDSKYPKAFKATRYKFARDCMKAYISMESDEDDLLNAIDELNAKEPESEFQENDINSSVEALEAILETDTTIFEDFEIDAHNEENQLVKISGVAISVNPDLIITSYDDDTKLYGALKFHISKTNTLSEESQNIVAVMLYLYAEKYLSDLGDKASTKLCFSFDVFNESIVSCPNAYKMRMRKIEAACEEIALWWDKL